MGDVIQGPWSDANTIVIDSEEITDDITLAITENLFDDMRRLGYDNLGEDLYVKDLSLINESIRSYLLKLQEKYHPCQDIANALFLDESGGLGFTNNVKVDFESR